MNNPVFVDLNKGLQTVIEARGDKLVTLDAQFNSLKQKNDVADLLQQQPAAIFINPVNWEGIKGTLIEAKRAKVPVVIVDAPVNDPDLVLCQVASDNVEAGRLACTRRTAYSTTARPFSEWVTAVMGQGFDAYFARIWCSPAINLPHPPRWNTWNGCVCTYAGRSRYSR
jgi:ABC-type xylose transport system substrate-binding protein